MTALVAFAAWRSIESGREALPFLATIALFLVGYLGLLASNFPYIVPPFGDTVFVYWIFSREVCEGEGYH